MPSSTRILICDHRGEGLTEALSPLATVGLRLEVSDSPAKTRLLLREGTPDLIVVETLSSGGVTELEALRRHKTPPILVVADPADPLPALQAARSLGDGPWDVVYRGAPLEEVLMRIERLQGQAGGLVELDQMRFAAVHDDRTQLLRPIPFSSRLLEHFSAAQRHKLDLALILLDLDSFGQVNKDFDHVIGDAVIDRVGKVVRENLRAEDVGGRVGGDEFAIVLPYTNRIDAARVVHRIHEQVRGLTGLIGDSEKTVSVSTSIGFETYDGFELDAVETLRRHAEQALRRAKELGGDRALYFRNLENDSTPRHEKRSEATGN